MINILSNIYSLHANNGVKINDLRDYVSGTYLVRLTDNGKLLQTAKFVKY